MKFYEQVTACEKVFSVEDGGSFLVFKIGAREVVPFWSSKSRVVSVLKKNPKYAKWTLNEEPLENFIDRTLAQLEKEKISVGVNWSGTRLVGYDISASELKRTLEYWTKKKAEANQPVQRNASMESVSNFESPARRG